MSMDDKKVSVEVREEAWLHEQKVIDWMLFVMAIFITAFCFAWALTWIGVL
jgi:hypothetical protein